MFSLSASRSGADPPNPAATRPDPTATAPAPGGGGEGNSDDSSSSSLSTLPSLPSTSTLCQQAPVTIKDEDLGYDSGSGNDDGLPRPNESEVYYFAYGVDFDPVRMKEEILPDAVHLGLARLDGFRWLLCGPPRRECKCTFPLNHPSPPPAGLVVASCSCLVLSSSARLIPPSTEKQPAGCAKTSSSRADQQTR